MSDAISRLSKHDNPVAKSKAEPIANFNITIHDLEQLTGFKHITLKEIQSETEVNVQMEQLKNCIIHGFPKTKHKCTELTHNFYDSSESLTIINGIVMKDKRVVIPIQLHESALDTQDGSHMGIVKTKECTSTCMFWPKMYADIDGFFFKM